MESSRISLCKSDRTILGNLTGIKPDTCSLKKNITNLWELSFEVEKYITENERLVQSDYYDSIDEKMKLYLDNEDEQIFFVIDTEPVIHGEGSQEIKTVTAHSEECELQNIFLKNFKINCGTNDSQEYLATDEHGNYNNINSYTGLPLEYISLVNYENEQLSLLHLTLQNTGWKVKDDIDPDVCSIKANFDISSNNVYAFLMSIVSPAVSVIFEFDRKHKKIGVTKIEKYGEDTGIFITMRNLMNSFDVSSSSDDGIVTKLVPTGADNLGIEYVNFGADHIINLDYFMNTLNEYGDYKYVSPELHDKYTLWKNYREVDTVEYNEKEYTRRELYAELSRLYNKTIIDISELKNRVPNDGTIIDYKTFSYEDLRLSLTAYYNALDTLITLYKNEYGATDLGEAPDYTPTPSSAPNIKDTPYWYDFYAYKEKIIPQVLESLKMYCQTDKNGNLVVDKNGDYIRLEFGNPDYYTDETIVKNIDSYLYEWSLYGLDELESKKKAWSEAANLLFSECFIKSGTASSPTAYLSADESGWNSLAQEQKNLFTTQKAFIDKLNHYLDYMSFEIRDNGLTKTKCKGVIRQCEDAILERTNEISSIEQIQKSYNQLRSQIASDVTLRNFKINNTTAFTEKDINIINSMLLEQEYKNENILTTNLDDIVSTVDVQEELYKSATEELYKLSQPQYNFRTELDNVYALEEFKCYQKPFRIGNFIRVGLETHEELFDNNFIKLRLTSITYNPIIFDENISVEFSTMIKTLNGMSDLAFLLNSDNVTSGSSSTSSSSSNGTYGNNDANVQISNNMLNALLSTELFGTTVNDVILDSIKANKGNFNVLLSHSGVFDVLEAGQIKVSGDCLFDIIKSSNYIDGKSGTMLNLNDGSFSFAAGALTYNPQKGLFIDTKEGSTNIDGECIKTGSIKSNNYNGTASNPLGNTRGTILQLSDGNFNYGGGKLKLEGEQLSVNGNIVATTLTANQSGNIAGWTFNANGFYKGNQNIAGINGMYIGNDGFSLSDYFVVKQDGMYIKSKDWISPTYQYNIGEETGSYAMILNPGDYIKIYIRNIENIDYFAMSWQYSLSITMQGAASIMVTDKYSINGYGIGRTELADAYYFDGESVAVLTKKYDELYTDEYLSDRTVKEYIDKGFIPQIQNVCIQRIYSNARTINNKFFYAVQIEKVEIYNSNNILYQVIQGNRTNTPSGMMINTFSKNIYTDKFAITNNELIHSGVYDSTVSESPNLSIDSRGRFTRSASSSKRYKTDITTILQDDISPEKLYDLDIVSYKYKNKYLSVLDQRYEKDIIGFTAEDVYEKYPIACNLDKDGIPEMWNINILFPAAVKLIQDQHREIEEMKQQFQDLKMVISNQG